MRCADVGLSYCTHHFSAIGVRSLSDTLVNSLFTCNIHTLVIDNNPVSCGRMMLDYSVPKRRSVSWGTVVPHSVPLSLVRTL
jgi:hypothetical protein